MAASPFLASTAISCCDVRRGRSPPALGAAAPGLLRAPVGADPPGTAVGGEPADGGGALAPQDRGPRRGRNARRRANGAVAGGSVVPPGRYGQGGRGGVPAGRWAASSGGIQTGPAEVRAVGRNPTVRAGAVPGGNGGPAGNGGRHILRGAPPPHGGRVPCGVAATDGGLGGTHARVVSRRGYARASVDGAVPILLAERDLPAIGNRAEGQRSRIFPPLGGGGVAARRRRVMKKLLNTLYITTQGTYLHRDGETVAVKKDDDILLRVPIHTLEGIVCFGHVLVSPPAMELCAEHGVLISYLSEHGKFWARVQGAVRGNVLLRRQQYRLADDAERSAAIAQTAVMAKIANCRTTLLRAAREREGGLPDVEAAADRLGRALDMLLRQQLPVDRVRGVEGECARHYFSVFDSLILQQKEAFVFRGRSRRPPLDAVNALLSFVYTLLVHDVTSALESVGLDPYVGFLHVDRPGRASLALDLIEEFRPVLADRLVLSLINRQQVAGDGFTKAESGAVMMEAATRRVVLEAWQKRKQDEVRHPFLDEAAPLGLFPYLQALLLARHVRGDLDAYPALVWK